MTSRSIALIVVALCGLAGLASCSASGGPAASSDAGASSTIVDPMDSPISGCPLPPAGEQAALVDLVLADAACRANVPDSAVVIKVMTPATWSDGSLGCPQPGMSYTQAEVSGWQAIVDAGGTRLDYRIRGPGQYLICKNPPG